MGTKLIEEELLENGIEEGDLDREGHLVQGCADPRVIEFPRDARARKRFRCAAAFRVSCGASLALATSAGRILSSARMDSHVGSLIIVNTSFIDNPFPWLVSALFHMPLHLAAAYRRHVHCL